MSLRSFLFVVLIWFATSLAWLFLGGVNSVRKDQSERDLSNTVEVLWGRADSQLAPSLAFIEVKKGFSLDDESRRIDRQEAKILGLSRPSEKAKPSATGFISQGDGSINEIWVREGVERSVHPESADLSVRIDSEPRRKGLIWYALYGVWFEGVYLYEHQADETGYLDVHFALPSSEAVYDDLHFRVNGEDKLASLDAESGAFRVRTPVTKGTRVELEVGYRSRGMDEWSYQPGAGVQRLNHFELLAKTNFDEVDFVEGGLSPVESKRIEDGREIAWRFDSLLSGKRIGLVLPQRIQPGELAAAISFSAPLSLLFFFGLLMTMAILREIDLHPLNYFFIAAGFFSFPLLFSYLVDQVDVVWSFAIASAVSVGLVVSYLRLAVSPRFAWREAMLGQCIYLIGFALAHFWEGFTGLTITLLSILTLFVLMQWTGAIRWREVFRRADGDVTALSAGGKP